MENLTIHTGVIADNREMVDTLITNQEQFDKFLLAIATNEVVYDDGGKPGRMPDIRFEPNTTDYFLNLTEKIDFSKINIIVVTHAKIKQVKVDNNSYQVNLDGEPTGDFMYSAVIVEKVNDVNEMNVIDQKRPCRISQRPLNNNY